MKINFNLNLIELWFWRIAIIVLLGITLWQEVEITRLYKVNEQLEKFDVRANMIHKSYNEMLSDIVDALNELKEKSK